MYMANAQICRDVRKSLKSSLKYLGASLRSLRASRRPSLESFRSSLSQVASPLRQVPSQVLSRYPHYAFFMFGAFIHELCDATLRNFDTPYRHSVLMVTLFW